jgi:hypothetical protein
MSACRKVEGLRFEDDITALFSNDSALHPWVLKGK